MIQFMQIIQWQTCYSIITKNKRPIWATVAHLSTMNASKIWHQNGTKNNKASFNMLPDHCYAFGFFAVAFWAKTIFVLPAKHSDTEGSLCPLSVCLSVRLSHFSVTLSKAMFRRRHMHSSECCNYFFKMGTPWPIFALPWIHPWADMVETS